jgi:hypothetical protein
MVVDPVVAFQMTVPGVRLRRRRLLADPLHDAIRQVCLGVRLEQSVFQR